MKIILTAINAKYIHSSLAIRSIDAYCQMPEIECAEYTINEPEQQIFASLYQKKASVYAFSCYIWNIEKTIKVAGMLKKVLPDAKIAFGGPESSFRAEELLSAYSWLDYVMIGEGEETAKELFSALKNRTDINEISALAYRNENSVVFTKERPYLDMDDLIFPYDEATLRELEGHLVYYESSRGCPFGCAYCMSANDKRVRFRNIEQVKKELSFLIQHRVPIVKFVDRTFNCDKERTKELFRFLMDQNGETLFHFEISADLLDDETIEILAQAKKGLFQFEIGVQSTNLPTLTAIHRTCDLNRAFSSIRKLIKQGNIHIHLDLIAGLPHENLERFEQSFNDVFSLRPDMLQLGFLKVLYGSKMEAVHQDYGMKYMDHPPYEILETHQMKADDFLLLKRTEDALERFYNSGKFTYSMDYLLKNQPSPFRFFLTLSEYMKPTMNFRDLFRVIYEIGDRSDDFLFAFSIDFLLSNQGVRLPEFIPRDTVPNEKTRVHHYLKMNFEDMHEALRNVRIEPIFGKMILINYKTKEWKDISANFPPN